MERLSEFLGERTRRKGVWWVIPLGVKETELLVGRRVKVDAGENSGAKFNSPGRSLRLGTEKAGKESRPEMEMTKKESLILFPRRRGRRRRVKRPRKTAIWLRLCTSAKLQSS